MFKKLFSHSLLYALGPQLPKLVGIFLLPVVTRYLTPDDYAIWGLCMAYTAGLAGLRDLGFAQVMVNSFYRYSEQRWKIVWRHLLGVLILWGIVYSVLLATLLYFTLRHKVGSNMGAVLFYTIIPALLFDLITSFGSRFYQFSAKPLPIAVNAVCAGVISLVVNYVAVVYWDMHYMSFFIASFAAGLFNAIYFSYPVFIKQKLIPILQFRFQRLKPHLRVGLPTIPHTYSAYLLNVSDRVILDIYRLPLPVIGQYNFAYNFGNYAEMVGTAFGMAVSPVYIKLYALGTEKAYAQVKIFTYFLQGLFLAGTVFISIWCKEILAFLSSNRELADTYPLVILIIMSYTYRPMYWATVNRLGFEENTGQLWKISFLGGIINVVLNVILIPFLGVYAVVLSTFIGLMYIGFSGFYLKAFRKVNRQNYYPLVWLAIIFATTTGVFLIRDCSIGTKLLLSVSLLCFIAVIILKNRNVVQGLKEIE